MLKSGRGHPSTIGMTVALICLLAVLTTACNQVTTTPVRAGWKGWKVQLTGAHVYDISFADAANGWAVGDTILHTTNGGATWQKQTMPPIPEGAPAMYFSAVDAVDAQHAWAVGSINRESNQNNSTGLIAATADGGAHWQVQYFKDSPMLFSVAFANAQLGWVAGGPWPSMVLHTTDGGAHWRRDPFPRNLDNVGTICCVDLRHLWVLSAPTKVFASADGGETWHVEHTGLRNIYAITGGEFFTGDMQFLDTTHGWLVGGQNGAILVTTDGGASWQRQKLPPRPSMAGLQLATIHFADLQYGWVSGQIGDRGCFAQTTDGGRHWRWVHRLGSVATMVSIGPDHLWALTEGGRVLSEQR